jgi:Immunoglobulin I-set domain
MISWSKDGQPLQSSSKVTIQDQGKVLMVDHVQREDAGMYQCLIRTDDDSAQGTAEIRLGGKQSGGKGEFQEWGVVLIGLNDMLTIFCVFQLLIHS